MKRLYLLRTVLRCFCVATPLFVLAPLASAQTSSLASRMVAAPVNISKMVALHGNVRPEANSLNDRGAVSGSLAMEHMLLELNRPAEREADLTALLAQQYEPGNPNFHQWLTASELGQRFGPNPQDIEAVTDWLTSQGFVVNGVSKSGLTVDFSGSARQVKAAFRTEIHNLNVNGKAHIGNMQDPEIPAALAGAVRGIVSLNDFTPHPANRRRSSAFVDPVSKGIAQRSAAREANPNLTVNSAYQLVVPDDLHTIYDFQPVYKKGITGNKQTVVVIEDTDVYSTGDWSAFRQTFGLSQYTAGSFTQIHPGGCKDPGVQVGDDAEAILDAEYASAAAPSAAIVLASCRNTKTTFGGLLAMQALIDETLPPSIISISYGECESRLGAAGNAAFNLAYQQAAAEGVSVFVSSGDEGAASCDADKDVARHGVAVSGLASTPYNVAVGGTDFGDAYAGTNGQYWKSKNNSIYGSAKSYIPEIPWNSSCASTLLTNALGYNVPFGKEGFCNSPEGIEYFITTVSGSGGPSGCAYGAPVSLAKGQPAVSGTCAGYAKPNYQAVFGNPGDGVRDIPDLSLFAANGVWGHYYVFCYSDPAAGEGGAPCTGDPVNWSGGGGTSFGAPILAGIQALINQSTGTPQGNPNYVYYALARQELGGTGKNSCNATLGNGVDSSCTFRDVTEGDNDVDCHGPDCYRPSGKYGVLSLSSEAYEKTYNSTLGWDFTTGIGTPDVANLVKNWKKAF